MITWIFLGLALALCGAAAYALRACRRLAMDTSRIGLSMYKQMLWRIENELPEVLEDPVLAAEVQVVRDMLPALELGAAGKITEMNKRLKRGRPS